MADEAGEATPPLSPQLIQEALNPQISETFGIATTDAQAAAQLPHEELDRGEALDLLSSVFGTEIEDPARIFLEPEVEHYISDHAAVVASDSLGQLGGGEEPPSGARSEPVLIESSLPLRTEDAEGQMAPVDLGLEHSEGELQPANPLVDTGIPLQLGEGISLANEDVTLELPEASGERAPTSVQGEGAFYPNVQTDTDLMVVPSTEGVETFEQLRSAESPDTEQFKLDLPAGAHLAETPEGGAEATLNGRALLSVPPPTAIDAAGNAVPTSLTVSGGDTVEVTAAPIATSIYPILVDPLWRYEIWNWTWENSTLSTWEGVSTTPASYQALPYTYWDPGHFKGLDMTSGFLAYAPQYAAASWYYHVPRFNSDWSEYKERPQSFIFYMTLSSAMFLLQGNNAVSPVMVAGIIDESKGAWVSVGQHGGNAGEITGWSGNFGYPNENPESHEPDTHAQEAVVALTATEAEGQAKYRNAFVGTGWVGMSDHNVPKVLKLQGPSEWMNAAETSHITYAVEDIGLGVFELQLFRPGETTPTGYGLGCSGLPASPCKRVYASTQSGAVNLAINPASAPEGRDRYKVLAADPLGSGNAPNQGESAGPAEPTGHAATQEAIVGIDHSAPTLSLSGSLTEQGTLGTAKPQYTLKYAATDGAEEAPTLISAFGAEGANPGQFKHPADVAIDSSENVWITDENNNRIERRNEKGEFTAFGTVGSGNGQLNHPTGIETDSSGNVWVADTGNNRIEEFNSEGKYVTAFGAAGSTNGKLSAPQGIAIDSSGNVWVADTGNNRIEEFSSSGTFLGAFGTKGSGQGQLSEPSALDVGPGGNVWVADTANNRTEEFSEAGEYIAAYGSLGSGNGQLNHPDAIDVDTWGNVWVGDQGNSRVEQFSERGEYLGKFGSAGTGAGQFSFSAPIGLTTNRAGQLWVTDSGSNRIENWTAPHGTRSGVRKVVVKVDGKVVQEPKLTCETGGCPLAGEWALQSGAYSAGSHVVEVSATDGVGLTTTQKLTISLSSPMPSMAPLSGTMTEQATLGKTRPHYNLKLSATAELGNGIPTSTPPTYIRSIGSLGSGEGKLSHPADVALTATGNLWVVDQNNNRVEELSPKGTYLGQVGTSSSEEGKLSHPAAAAVDSKGNLWVADAGNKRVVEFSEAGKVLAKFGGEGTAEGKFGAHGPEGIGIDSKGNVWVSDSANSRLEEFSAEGKIIKVVGAKGGGLGQLSEPGAIEIAPDNKVWVTDWANNRVEVYNEAGEWVRQFGTEGTGARQFKHPDGIAIDASGNVWVGDQNNQRVQEFNQSGRYLAEFGSSGSGAGQFSLGFPIGIAVDPQGVLWVTDPGNNRVERWREPSRSLIKTEIAVDGVQVEAGEVSCTTETCPATLEWSLDSLSSLGKHTIVAKATDGFGNTTTKSLNIEVLADAAKPTLEVGGELANAPEGWVQQESYGVHASATDPGGYGVTSLAFKIDGATVASTTQSCPAGGCEALLSKSISMAPYSGGSHAAEVVATDGAGNTTITPWTINVDPEGHVSTAESTATLEAVEGTSDANLVGKSKEEEGIEGSAPGLKIKSSEGELIATGTQVPLTIEQTAGGGFTAELPEAQEFEPCNRAEEAEELCEGLALPEGNEEGMVPIQIAPLGVKEGASVGNLVEETAVVSANSGSGSDVIVRPLSDGGMYFEAIRDDTAPEEYSWRVELSHDQELKLIDDQHAEVYYNDNTPAFSVTAEAASDAVGTEVPTTLSVSKGEIVTLTVHYKAGHEGQPFVYPVVGGTGWEGGFRTEVVDMGDAPPEVSEGETYEFAPGLYSTIYSTFGPPSITAGTGGASASQAPKVARPFDFNNCHWRLKSGTQIPAPPQKEELARISHQCHGTELGGTYVIDSAAAVAGVFHYRRGEQVWVDEQPECFAWGLDKPEKKRCEVPITSSQEHIDAIGDFRYPPGAYGGASWAPGKYWCSTLDGVMPKNPLEQLNGEWVYHEKYHLWGVGVVGSSTACPWGHFEHPVGR